MWNIGVRNVAELALLTFNDVKHLGLTEFQLRKMHNLAADAAAGAGANAAPSDGKTRLSQALSLKGTLFPLFLFTIGPHH